jgi:hypothetical protein
MKLHKVVRIKDSKLFGTIININIRPVSQRKLYTIEFPDGVIWDDVEEHDIEPTTLDATIVVKKRSDDYHACMKDNEGVWGCGKDPVAAIGSLINAHRDYFNLEIEYI